jgi:glycosyltransferase involved in cell wall biosynthesis
MKVALIHDWLTGMRGGEKVLEQLCLMYPQATVHTLVYIPERISEIINRHPVRTSMLQSPRAVRDRFRWFLPLFPTAVERFDLTGFDLVVSSSHCAALGVRAPKGAVHVCYSHTPMRYAWEHFDLYFPVERWGRVLRGLIALNMARLRAWEVRVAQRVDGFVANSHNVARRIRDHYGREARVVHPPVDVDFFTPGDAEPDDTFLIASALVPYKQVDLAIEAFNRLERPLVVIGEGPERERLEEMAGPQVRFLGWCSSEQVRHHYRRACALIMPGEEDFGITPLEAAACGTPTLALGRGGTLETVVDGKTGVLFAEPTVESLMRGVERIDRLNVDPEALRTHAVGFSAARFREEMARAIDQAIDRAQRQRTTSRW